MATPLFSIMASSSSVEMCGIWKIWRLQIRLQSRAANRATCSTALRMLYFQGCPLVQHWGLHQMLGARIELTRSRECLEHSSLTLLGANGASRGIWMAGDFCGSLEEAVAKRPQSPHAMAPRSSFSSIPTIHRTINVSVPLCDSVPLVAVTVTG